MAEIIQLPEGGGSASGAGNIPFSIPIGGFSGNGGFNGNGQTNLMDLLGFAIIASIFPNFFGGRGNQGQFSGMDSELAIQAVTAQGDASRTAIQTLASSIGQDFNIVYGAVSNVQNILQNIAMQQATSVPQIINAIQSGNTALASQFCQCCCEQKLLTTEQGYQAQIRTIEQTNQLGSQADRNTASIVGAINALQTNMTKEFCDVKEREMQEKINTLTANNALLRSQIDNAQQTANINGYIGSLIAPLQREVDKIRDSQPNTVPVVYPNLSVVNNTPYNGGFYGGFYGNGWGGNVVF